jgi:biopolymer transport protein ExbD
MAKKGINKKSISLDMTAMCDMAFLLLTFFILTAKMKANDPAPVEIPSSHADAKVPEDGMIRITVTQDGRIFFGVSEFKNRVEIYNSINAEKKLNLTKDQIQSLATEELIGIPFDRLGEFADLPISEKTDYEQVGIPADTMNNELQYWVRFAKDANPKYVFGVKADLKTDYAAYNKVIRSLQEMRYNKFSLITSLEQQ